MLPITCLDDRTSSEGARDTGIDLMIPALSITSSLRQVSLWTISKCSGLKVKFWTQGLWRKYNLSPRQVRWIEYLQQFSLK
jgi:hypothetical protein